MNSISIIGTGYVGLVTGTCLSEFGLSVLCMDTDAQKIRDLEQGVIPIYEPGLPALITKNVSSGRLRFTTDMAQAVSGSQVIFLAVPTPPGEDGSADLQHVLAAVDAIAQQMTDYKVIVNKSTVPIGTGRKVKEIVRARLDRRGLALDFDVVSNPEFLREGSAVRDFMHPDRVVIGSDNEKSREIVRDIYNVLYLVETPFIFTSHRNGRARQVRLQRIPGHEDRVHQRDRRPLRHRQGRCPRYRQGHGHGRPDRQVFPPPRPRVRRQLPAQGHQGPGQDRTGAWRPHEHRRRRRQGQRVPAAPHGPEDRGRARRPQRQGHRRSRPGVQAGHRRHPRIIRRPHRPRIHPTRRARTGLRSAGDGQRQEAGLPGPSGRRRRSKGRSGPYQLIARTNTTLPKAPMPSSS